MEHVAAAFATTIAALLLLRVGLRFAPASWRARGRAEARLRVVETLRLSGAQRMHLVEVDGERLLVVSSDGAVPLLHRLSSSRHERARTQPEAPPSAAGAPALTRAPGRLGSFRPATGRWVRWVGLALVATSVLGAGVARAEAAQASALGDAVAALVQPDRISGTLQIVLALTLVSVAPSILLMATCFTRVVIVLSLLRQAVGLPQLPPNQVIVGLALLTTLFVMAPVGQRIQSEAIDPFAAREVDGVVALQRAATPLREFMLANTREADLAFFVDISKTPPPATPAEVSLVTLLPAFLVSEMRTAFEIGFTLYLPFLVIDLVVASMLISMGMIVLPPMVVSIPFKLMLFVLLDGWNLVVGGLVDGIH